MMTTSIDRVLARVDANQQAAITRLCALLRIPSNSFDPAHHADCEQAAHWCARALESLGFTASVRPTIGHPMVVGHRVSKTAGARHLLFYGHYDVQPPDPLDLWHAPPYEPQLLEHPVHGKILVARGASDDKGQLMTFIEAARAWIETEGDLPVSLTVLIEGDEEADSAPLDGFLKANADELKAELALVCDSGAWDAQTPAITTSLRGYAGAEITVRGPSRDLHSGTYGGAAINPIRALSDLIAGLHDADGRVAIPGFYDGIEEVSPAQRSAWQRLGFDPDEFMAEAGLTQSVGERGRSVLELIWARPTADVNGIWGGYQGPGSKTVIPSQAHAKVSFRLVPGQDHRAIIPKLEAFLRQRLMADCVLEVKPWDASRAAAFDPGLPFMRRAAAALVEEWGREPAFMGSGGSIPIVAAFKDLLGMDSLMIGFALDDDGAHSPNEKYNLSAFAKGCRSWARVLAHLAAPGAINRSTP